eukprot:6551560-Pyramimonas_sp.AAC.1
MATDMVRILFSTDSRLRRVENAKGRLREEPSASGFRYTTGGSAAGPSRRWVTFVALMIMFKNPPRASNISSANIRARASNSPAAERLNKGVTAGVMSPSEPRPRPGEATFATPSVGRVS